jgi:hypothetical protein
MKKASFIQTAALTALIIIVPGFSWYYLQKGLSYRKAILSELKDYGKLEPFATKNIDGKPLSLDSVTNHLIIANVINPKNAALSEQTMQVMLKFHDQFDERWDVQMMTQVTDADSASVVENYIKKYKITDFAQWRWLAGNQLSILDAMKIKANRSFDADCPYIAFVDSNRIVRNFYDVRDEEAIKRMVEHVALKLRRDPKEKVEVRRKEQ